MTSLKTLENLGRTRLSPGFFMRDFLYSEVAQIEGIANIQLNIHGYAIVEFLGNGDIEQLASLSGIKRVRVRCHRMCLLVSAINTVSSPPE
jgi:hypothetical protein